MHREIAKFKAHRVFKSIASLQNYFHRNFICTHRGEISWTVNTYFIRLPFKYFTISQLNPIGIKAKIKSILFLVANL